jgi:hypothetical protein
MNKEMKSKAIQAYQTNEPILIISETEAVKLEPSEMELDFDHIGQSSSDHITGIEIEALGVELSGKDARRFLLAVTDGLACFDVKIRLNVSEIVELKAWAKETGQSVSEFVRKSVSLNIKRLQDLQDTF